MSTPITYASLRRQPGNFVDLCALDGQRCGVYRYTREQPGRHPSAGKGGVAAEAGHWLASSFHAPDAAWAGDDPAPGQGPEDWHAQEHRAAIRSEAASLEGTSMIRVIFPAIVEGGKRA